MTEPTRSLMKLDGSHAHPLLPALNIDGIGGETDGDADGCVFLYIIDLHFKLKLVFLPFKKCENEIIAVFVLLEKSG